jgi:hypothetical protein
MKRLMLASSTFALTLAGGSLAFAQGYDYYPPSQPPPPQAPPPQAQPQYGASQEPAARMADRLLEDTAELRDQIARELPPGGQRDAALQSVRRLEHQAQRFEQAVDSLGPQNEATRAEFGRLTQSYGFAANDMEALRGYPRVYYEFAHIQRVMDRMAPMFGGYQQYGYRYQNPGNGYRMSGPGLNIGVGGLNFHIDRD